MIVKCLCFPVLCGNTSLLWPQAALVSGIQSQLVHMVKCSVYLHLKCFCVWNISQTLSMSLTHTQTLQACHYCPALHILHNPTAATVFHCFVFS